VMVTPGVGVTGAADVPLDCGNVALVAGAASDGAPLWAGFGT
jgi:hypothetical protein